MTRGRAATGVGERPGRDPADCGGVRRSRPHSPMHLAHQAGSPTGTAPGTTSSPGGSPILLCTARLSRAEPLPVTDARARRALPLSRSADRAPSMLGPCRFRSKPGVEQFQSLGRGAGRGSDVPKGAADPGGDANGSCRASCRSGLVPAAFVLDMCTLVGAHTRHEGRLRVRRLPNRVIRFGLPCDDGHQRSRRGEGSHSAGPARLAIRARTHRHERLLNRRKGPAGPDNFDRSA